MSIKNKVVIHNPTTKKHEPLASGDVLAGSIIQVSTDAGNSLQLGTDGGLKVAAVAQLPDDQVLTGDTTGSVAVSLTPTTVADGQVNYSIKADTKIDPAAGNIATVTSAGVYVPTPVIPTPTDATAPVIVDDGTTTTQYYGSNEVALGSPLKWVSTDGGTTVSPVYSASGVSGSVPVVSGSKQTEFGEVIGNANYDVAITFSTAFPTIPFITLTPVLGGNRYSDFYAYNITTTGFSLRRGYLSNSGGLVDIAWKAEEK